VHKTITPERSRSNVKQNLLGNGIKVNKNDSHSYTRLPEVVRIDNIHTGSM